MGCLKAYPGTLSSIYASEWHHLSLCFLLCLTSGGILPLNSDKKLRLLQCAFHARGLLGCPQEQEVGLHQVYKYVAWLFLSLTVVEFGLMQDFIVWKIHHLLSPFTLEPVNASSQQTWTNGSPIAPCMFLQSFHHTIEGQRHHEDWRRWLLMWGGCAGNGQWAHGTSPLYSKRQDSGVLKHAVRKWTSTGVDGLCAAYFNNWGLEHYTQIITPKAGSQLQVV